MSQDTSDIHKQLVILDVWFAIDFARCCLNQKVISRLDLRLAYVRREIFI